MLPNNQKGIDLYVGNTAWFLGHAEFADPCHRCIHYKDCCKNIVGGAGFYFTNMLYAKWLQITFKGENARINMDRLVD